MAKLWEGRNDGVIDASAEMLNASIIFDSRLYIEDIEGSIAHVKMLSDCKIITKDEGHTLVNALEKLKKDIDDGVLKIDYSCEDIHSFVEMTLTKQIGDVAKKIHTARSRNDQTVLDLRLWLKKRTDEILRKLNYFLKSIVLKAEENQSVIMPGFTHLQHAQPILFSHWILAYANMIKRDIGRFSFLLESLDYSPIGACALAGTTFDIDRHKEAEYLGLTNVIPNSIDAVSDRDFALDFLFDCSILIMHMSRFCEEIIIFSSTQYSFLKVSDEFSTGSSIMPQKKNPDMAELIRGKTGRIYGNLISLLTVMKSLPLSYNKDMQEDKESIFDSADTISLILDVFPKMISTLIVNKANMLESANKGFLNATDMADYLVDKGMPFRDAYNLCGRIVNYSVSKSKTLNQLTLDEFKSFSQLFENDIYKKIDIENCVNKRNSYGGTGIKSVIEQINEFKKYLG